MSFGRALAVRSWLIALFAFFAACAPIAVVQPKPDCRLFREAWDQPTGTYSVRQPRIAWHAERAVLGGLATKALERGHVPKPIARFAPAAVQTGLHVYGVLRHEYPLNPGDWFADDFIASPATMPWPLYASLYGPTACLASP